MVSKLIEILVMEGIAVLLFIFAYLIGVKGKLELIAGYNEQTASKVKTSVKLGETEPSVLVI